MTDIPGLDAAGRVAAVGDGVDTPVVGDFVCALTNGGAYADFVVVPGGAMHADTRRSQLH